MSDPLESTLRFCRDFIFDPVITAGFEFESQFLAAALDDAAVHHHMHLIRHDVIEQSLIVRDKEDRFVFVGLVDFIDAVGDGAEGVDVESGVGFVEEPAKGINQRQQEDFVAFLFTTGKAFIDGAVHEAFVHLEEVHFFLDDLTELHGVEFGQPVVFSCFIDRGFEEVACGNAGDFDGVLEAEKQTLASAFLGGHVEKVFAVE